MSRGKHWLTLSSWLGCGVVLVMLWTGLDPYRRPPIEGAYGPHLRHYYASSLAKAEELEDAGSYQLVPEDSWHLLSGWEETPTRSNPPRALARPRRVRLLVPVARAQPITIRLDIRVIPEANQEPEPIVVEFGLNGVSAGRAQVSGGRNTVLSFEVPEPTVYRGDNIVFLYRVTRRAESSPWLSLGTVDVLGADSGEAR
ncbi:MAG TPA: hypothetical protein VEK15_13040 [Vicinamibacteria bacterium]|nr:hypothetical protein [Vicinamibacteria bacterium]